MKRSRLLVFASGTATGGGSGFEELARAAGAGVLGADIVAVVSNHDRGGVRLRAERLGVPFVHMPGPWSDEAYQRIARGTLADYVACSGWLKLVRGLDPAVTINIHPGPLPAFGGTGLYGRHVHEAVMAAYGRGELTHTAVCMHFVTPEYDRGPVFFRLDIPIMPDDTPETLAARVNALEHEWQWRITRLVVTGQIRWSGRPGDPVLYPRNYAPGHEVGAQA